MSPTIHCVRHAQGFHNLNHANHSMPDPLLTPLGEEQCANLHKTFPYHSSVDLVVASPLKRTMHTALLGFSDDIAQKDLRVIALPEIQETSDLPCDTGSDVEELRREFEGKPIDLSLVKSGWNSKTGVWASTSNRINARAREARRWLRDRDEHDVVVVTHGGFLHYFTEDWDDYNRFTGTGWANTEFRSFTFDPDGGDNASLVETKESRRRRAGSEKPLTEAEQRNLRETAQKSWQQQGFNKTDSAQEIQSKV